MTDDAARFVERFGAMLEEGGVPRMPARVFAALLATDSGRLTAAELAEQLRISPAAVSGAVRYLIQVGLVTREREPGSRRDVYALHHDLWYEAIVNREPLLARWEQRARPKGSSGRRRRTRPPGGAWRDEPRRSSSRSCQGTETVGGDARRWRDASARRA